MRFFKYIPLIILTLVLTISSNAYTSGFYGEFKIPTNAVIDGDTFIIRVTDKNVPQRYYADLSGVDCPELDQPYGKLAKDRTVELLAGKRVKSPFDALIAWSRTIIDPVLVEPVIENGVSKSWIAKILVEEGSCWYDSHALSSDSRVGKALKEAQKEAQAARRGLWQQSNPIPPAEYRAHSLKNNFPE